MTRRQLALGALIATALVLPACFNKPATLVADGAKRKEIIEALVANPAMRAEVIDRLIGPPGDRAAVIDRILKDESAAGDLAARIMAQDRGKAIVASKVAADPAAKTFIRMLMLTGVMGESMTQQQASALGLGEPFAFGNQNKTMRDLKKVGAVIDAYAKAHRQEEGLRYPVCFAFNNLDKCLADKLPPGSLKDYRLSDAWGTPFQYHTDKEGKEYILVSYASDGQYDDLGKVGPTESPNCDIVFSNGDFVQWPGWIRKNDIH